MEKKEGDYLKKFLIVWVISFVCIFPFKSFSQEFPAKPISLLIGWEPGAANDLSCRPLAEMVQKELGVFVVPENKAGGGSTVAASLLSVKRPDGYTLGQISSAALTSRPLLMKLNYDPKGFTFLLAYSYYPGGICVRKDSPFLSLADMVRFCKENPEKQLAYSSTGVGAPGQMSIELLAKRHNIKFKHVPFKGASPAATALLGGHVDFTIGHGVHLQYVKQKEFRMLVLTNTDERDAKYPNVPTMKELGYEDVPSSRMMIIAPKGLPTPIFNKLTAAFDKSAHSIEFRKTLDTLDLPFAFLSGKELEEAISTERESFRKTLKAMGVKVFED